MWDDSGPRGFCCWVRWDWEKGTPLEMEENESGGRKEGEAGGAGAGGGGGGEGGGGGGRGGDEEKVLRGDASWWEVLSRALGPPLVPPTGIEPSEVGAWLDRHTMKVHGWLEEDSESEDSEDEEKETEVPAAAAAER